MCDGYVMTFYWCVSAVTVDITVAKTFKDRVSIWTLVFDCRFSRIHIHFYLLLAWRIVMPWFGPEPKFEPEPWRT